MNGKRRGMLVVLALLILGIALIAGIGLMSSQVASYRGVRAVEYSAQALALAQAGLEDARVKLEKDIRFPPVGDQAQSLYTYSEELEIDGQRLGCYRISVDMSANNPEYHIIRLTSTGFVGLLENPVAQRTLKAEIDTNPANVSTRFLMVRLEDLAGF